MELLVHSSLSVLDVSTEKERVRDKVMGLMVCGEMHQKFSRWECETKISAKEV